MMKKIIDYFVIIAATVFVLSCSNEDLNETITPAKVDSVPLTFESILDEEDMASTRSIITSKKFRWNGGDQINVFDNTETKNDAFVASGDAGTEYTAPSFSGSVSVGATDFYALYPYDSNATWTYSTYSATAYVPSYQGWISSAGNASQASKLHLLGAKIEDSKLAFKNLTSVIHIKPQTGLNLNEIKLEMGNNAPISGDCNVNLSSRSAGTGSSNTVMINYFAGGIAGGHDYYFVVLPTTERTINVTFKNKSGQYQTITKTLTNTNGIQAGKYIDFGEVSSTNLSSMADYNFTKVTYELTDWTGDYTFVYVNSGGGENAKYASFGNGNDNTRYYEDEQITEEGTVIAASSALKNYKIVTLVKKGSGYYIMHAGKYITGTNDRSFLTFEDTPTNGSLWTVVFDSTNKSVHFTNATGSKKLGFASGAGWRFTTSTSDFCLFKADY